jgi:hypothetical protein
MLPSLSFNDANFNLLIIFGVALAASWLGLVGVSHSAPSRSHSTTKFWNEMMARSQLTCVAFFLTVLRTAKFAPGGERLKDTIWIAMLIVVGLWLISQRMVNKQDESIQKQHECDFDTGTNVCRSNLRPWVVVKVLAGNAVLAVATLLYSALLIFNGYVY